MGNEEDTQTVGEVGNVSFGKYMMIQKKCSNFTLRETIITCTWAACETSDKIMDSNVLKRKKLENSVTGHM